METQDQFATVIDDLVELCGTEATKADLARKIDPFISKPVRPQDINNWRKRGIPPKWCDAVERAFNYAYPKHRMRPDHFSAPPSAA